MLKAVSRPANHVHECQQSAVSSEPPYSKRARTSVEYTTSGIFIIAPSLNGIFLSFPDEYLGHAE